MDITNIASFAEIISAIAVVVSLIFVGLEIRKNTQTTEAATFQASVAHDLELLLKMGDDPKIANTFFTYRDRPDELSEEEQFQGAHLMAATIRHVENLYLQYKKGMLSEDSWNTRKPLVVSIIKSKGFAKNTEVHYAGFYDGDFMKYAKEQQGQSGA